MTFLSEEVLMGIAGVAIALIGFSGVVTALGRRGSGSWSPSQSLQLRTLVDPSIVTLFSAFVPIGIGLVSENAEVIWRGANLACFIGHVLGVAAFIRRGSPGTFAASHKVGLTVSVIVLALMLGSATGILQWHALTFLLGLLLGIAVSVHNFYLLFFPAGEPVDQPSDS